MDEPQVGVIMGSRSDWETMKHPRDTLEDLGVRFETKVVSAHRTPELMVEYAKSPPIEACASSSPAPAGPHTSRA